MSSHQIPCVTLYTFDKELTPESIATVNRVVAQLKEKGIPQPFIQVHPLSNDRELAKRVMSEIGDGGKWPIVFVNGQAACDAVSLPDWLSSQSHFPSSSLPQSSIEPESNSLVSQLAEQAQMDELKQKYEAAIFEGRDGEAEEIMKSITTNQANFLDDEQDRLIESVSMYASHLEDCDSLAKGDAEAHSDSESDLEEESTDQEVTSNATAPVAIFNAPQIDQLGYMGQTLEGLERGVVGVSSYMRSAMNLVGLSPTDNNLEERYTDSTNRLTDRRPLAEFKVIQTNWYYRQQTRLLRFFQNCFIRVHPITEAVRSVHNYTDLTRVSTVNSSTFLLDYAGDSPREYYQSAFTGKIIELLKERVRDKQGTATFSTDLPDE